MTPSLSILKKDATNNDTEDIVNLLPPDNEVTVTKVLKKPRLENDSDSYSNDITPVVQRLGENPSISVRLLFPGEENMNLHVKLDFDNMVEKTKHGFEKYETVVQFDKYIKELWQELQRPYGSMSSFMRHLILLEKYFRLVLTISAYLFIF